VHNFEKEAQIITLQNFVDWFQNSAEEIKREFAEEADEVKIMSIHAAKGLEGRVVILADTTSIPKLDINYIWHEGLFFYGIQKKKFGRKFIDLFEEEERKIYKEYIRLLYVALTRAVDKLFIFGIETKTKDARPNWYQLI